MQRRNKQVNGGKRKRGTGQKKIKTVQEKWRNVRDKVKREAEIEVRTTGSPGRRQYEKIKSLQSLKAHFTDAPQCYEVELMDVRHFATFFHFPVETQKAISNRPWAQQPSLDPLSQYPCPGRPVELNARSSHVPLCFHPHTPSTSWHSTANFYDAL